MKWPSTMKWTSEWQLRCPKCGRTVRYEDVGGTRIGASIGKRILARCSQCRRVCWAIVEPIPDPADTPPAPAPQPVS